MTPPAVAPSVGLAWRRRRSPQVSTVVTPRTPAPTRAGMGRSTAGAEGRSESACVYYRRPASRVELSPPRRTRVGKGTPYPIRYERFARNSFSGDGCGGGPELSCAGREDSFLKAEVTCPALARMWDVHSCNSPSGGRLARCTVPAELSRAARGATDSPTPTGRRAPLGQPACQALTACLPCTPR